MGLELQQEYNQAIDICKSKFVCPFHIGVEELNKGQAKGNYITQHCGYNPTQ